MEKALMKVLTLLHSIKVMSLKKRSQVLGMVILPQARANTFHRKKKWRRVLEILSVKAAGSISTKIISIFLCRDLLIYF